MDRANKAMRQKFKRVQQNLGLSEKRDELQQVQHVDQRNQKIISAVATYRKNISNCIKTAAKEDEKRKKKLDEYPLMVDLASEAKEMDQNSCLSHVMRHISGAVNRVLDERIHLEQTVEKRVLEQLAKYLEMDKALAKSKEKLNNMIIDVDIARKALQSKHEEARLQELQEEVDTNSMRLENHKDATITDIFTLASKEQEIASVFAVFVEEQMEFHRSALLHYENALPEILREIANAHPRPVFGVELEEHLRHSGRRISLVLEKCCTMLKQTGFNEKGLFRVNGNNTKIKRMKAAFDAGQIDNDYEEYVNDPHSICSALKGYLRELPEPLLTNHLYPDWQSAIRLEGAQRVNEIQRVLNELPPANRENLTYLVNFLCEMLQYEHITMMNAGNLSIVFGPNLVGGAAAESDNITGSRVVETLLLNAGQLFGSAHAYPSTHHSHSPPRPLITASPAGSASLSSGSDSSLLARSMSSPHPANNSLSVDTHSNKYRIDISTVSPASAYSVSPSPNRGRPKQPAPAPPLQHPNSNHNDMSQSVTSLNSIRSDLAQAISLPSVPLQPTRTPSNAQTSSPAVHSSGHPCHSSPQFEPMISEHVTATFVAPVYAPSPVINELYTGSAPNYTSNQTIDHGGLDLSSLELLEREMVGCSSTSKSPSQGSQDSMNDYENDVMARSLSEFKPNRPPPPVARTASNASQGRPVSYQNAVQATAAPVPAARRFPVSDPGGSEAVFNLTSNQRAQPSNSSSPAMQHRPPIVHDSENRTLITLDTPERMPRSQDTTLERLSRGAKPPLPTKPKQEEITKL